MNSITTIIKITPRPDYFLINYKPATYNSLTKFLVKRIKSTDKITNKQTKHQKLTTKLAFNAQQSRITYKQNATLYLGEKIANQPQLIS